MNLGSKISERRKAMGMTQEELAANLGVSPQAVSKWENDLTCPDISLLPSIAKIFGTSVDELLSTAPLTENDKEENTDSAPEEIYEEPVFTGQKASTLVISTERDGKISNVNIPINVVRFGLNLSSMFGGLTGDQAGMVENAIRTGLLGEILSVDGENGEKVIISLI